MLKTQNLIPSVYYIESRDFQALGRVYDIIFNYIKCSTDLMSENPSSKKVDVKLLDLLTKTLGFESKHEYNANNLISLCNSFNYIIKHKGTEKSIEECVKVMLNSQGIKYKYKIIIEDYNVEIQIPNSLNDISLLEDMLEYVLPAGFTYNIRTSFVGAELPNTNVGNVNIAVSQKRTSEYLGDTKLNEKTNMATVVGKED